jgi:hypothetical protein
LSPLLLFAAALAACDSATAPRVPGVAASSGVGGTNMVPLMLRGTFGAAPGANPLTCNPPTWTIGDDRYAGPATGTYLGNGSILVYFDSCVPGDFTTVAWTVEGHLTLSAADGDEINGTFGMTQYVDGRFTLDLMTFVSGTGRFANVAGTASGGGVVDRTTHIGSYEISGLLTRPNN